MRWQGVVVSESLTDETVVNRLRVTDARIEGGLHRYWVETDEPGLALVRGHLRPGPWYAHFWRDGRLLALFADASFEAPAHDPAAQAEIREHAARRGLDDCRFDLATAPPGGAEDGSATAEWRLVLADEEVDTLLDSLEAELLVPLAAESAAGEPQRALDALRAVREALARPLPGRVLAPNRRWVHAGLQLAPLDPVDLEALHAVLRSLSAALAGAAEEEGYAATLRGLAARAGVTPQALTGALARLLAVVDLPPDEDTRLLRQALSAAPPSEAVLDSEQERAYQRLAHRVSMLLTEADPLHRFLLHPEPEPPGS